MGAVSKLILINSLFSLCMINCKGQLITTFVGRGLGGGGWSGDGGPATAAYISRPSGGNFDISGNYYFAIRSVNRIRKVSTTDTITTVAGTGITGFFGDGGPATLAQLNNPSDVAVDHSGNLYIVDIENNRIRKVDITSGIISTYVGDGIPGFSGDGGPATDAEINTPNYICIDKYDNLYISDLENERIRKIDSSGIISTVAGNGTSGFSSDGGLADTTMINAPAGVTVDTAGNLFIADNGNERVRKVDFATGIIRTVVGNGNGAYNGEGLTATAAQIAPWDVKFDAEGNLYIDDYGNQRIRKVNTSGIVYTVAGNGTAGFSGDGGPATASEIYDPEGVAIDACGNLYIADEANYRIRKVTFNPTCNLDSTALNTKRIQPANEISIYPNPAYTSITVTATNKINQITFTNLIGQIVYTQAYDIEKAEVNIAGLPEGVYIVRVTDSEDKITVSKILKQ